VVGTTRDRERSAAAGAGRVSGGPAAGASGHHRANRGSWAAVMLIIIGFALGAFALASHSTVLWIMTGVALVAGGVVALAFRIMEQAY